ncbi:MAG: RagB/SusD family nutrient uptake outer membrane protein [Chitinophagaceae bacterium]|nr:RagB/SusD family nutrient uptake outer membrane protein [Chitinophagaceae bacterium]MBK8952051.1 RagB/SusD family nutrient uptake outer membrane protein [Chitinophagaceae bacterium]
MKKSFLKFITALAVMVFLLPSCKKDYLTTAPTDQVVQTDIFKTTANAWVALNGIHRSLYIQYNSRQDQGGQSKNMIDMDMLGDDLVNPTTGNGWFLTTHRWTDHRNENAWSPYFNFQFYYDIIANANMIIANIDNATGPDADKKVIKGQALAYRAWAYFQMIQLFGKRYDKTTSNSNPGLSLVLTPTTEKLPRSTVAEVYAVIVTDLNTAITNLTGAPARANASHINLNVAKGLRARVALAMQDWAVAAQFANEARQGLSLMSTAQYLQGFNNYTNPEWMWGSRQVADQTTYFYSFFAYMSADFNSTNIRTNPKCINSALYNAIPASDIRKQLWDPTGTNTTFPIPPGGARYPYMNRKFLSGGGSASSIGDVPIMRVAEMYLIEAEARARAGGQDATAAGVLYSLLSQRNPGYVLSTNTGQALINEILMNRRVELWGEGFRFYDLKRLDLPLDRTGANHNASVAVTLTVPAGSTSWQFLIPRTELNANSKCIQNDL